MERVSGAPWWSALIALGTARDHVGGRRPSRSLGGRAWPARAERAASAAQHRLAGRLRARQRRRWRVGSDGGGVRQPRRRRSPRAGTPALDRLPVFVRFDGRRTVVVGGGAMAAAKIPALLAAGADVTVIAPHVSAAIDRARVRVVERPFVPADLDGAWFVTAAATPEVNRAVRDAAAVRRGVRERGGRSGQRHRLPGRHDRPRRGDGRLLDLGRAPALAGLLREAFDDLVPADIEAWASRAHELRSRQRAEGVPMAERRPELLDTLNHLYEGRERAQAGGRRSFMSPPAGFVSLVGAGPGDPHHLTFKAAAPSARGRLGPLRRAGHPRGAGPGRRRRPRLRGQARRPRPDLTSRRSTRR